MIRLFLPVVGFMVAGGLSVGADAQDTFLADLPSECTLENVAGVFGFNEDTTSSPLRTNPVALVGLLELSVDGSARYQAQVFPEKGSDVVIGPVVEGEWGVEANCFGEIDFPRFRTEAGRVEIDYAFVAVENGTELFLIRNNPLEEADAKLLFRR